MATYNAVAAKHAALDIEKVHRTTKAFGAARFLTEQLGDHLAGWGAFGDSVSVFTVGCQDVIIRIQGRERANGDGLLADRQVQEPADLLLGVGLCECLFHPSDGQNIAVVLEQRRLIGAGCHLGFGLLHLWALLHDSISGGIYNTDFPPMPPNVATDDGLLRVGNGRKARKTCNF